MFKKLKTFKYIIYQNNKSQKTFFYIYGSRAF